MERAAAHRASVSARNTTTDSIIALLDEAQLVAAPPAGVQEVLQVAPPTGRRVVHQHQWRPWVLGGFSPPKAEFCNVSTRWRLRVSITPLSFSSWSQIAALATTTQPAFALLALLLR